MIDARALADAARATVRELREQARVIRDLSRDGRTGREYAIGFDADGNPYRAFAIDRGPDFSGRDKFELAS